MKTLKKGFTLIELLVVIAIIGILASIVLASLNSARTQGRDAATIATLSNMRSQAELFYSTNGSNGYGTVSEGACPTSAGTGNVFNQATFINATTSLPNGSTGTRCAANGFSYAAAYPLSGANEYYCIDSSGAAQRGTQNQVNSIIAGGGASAFTCNLST